MKLCVLEKIKKKIERFLLLTKMELAGTGFIPWPEITTKKSYKNTHKIENQALNTQSIG